MMGQPIRIRTSHKRSLFTVSKALERSTKTINRSLCCSLHFSWSCRVVKTMSTVLLFFLNPHRDSGSIDSVMLLMSLRSITLARTLPATARSDMPLWLPQMALSPLFLNMVTMLASLHCCGMFSSAQTLVMYWCNVLFLNKDAAITNVSFFYPIHRLIEKKINRLIDY